MGGVGLCYKIVAAAAELRLWMVHLYCMISSENQDTTILFFFYANTY